MFPQWFDKWNRENPKDIYGPAILVGVAGGALFVAAMVVTWGQPFATTSMQTGPRGTGMHVARFDSQVATPDPTIAGFVTSAPVVPQPGDPTAREVYGDDVEPLFGDLTQANYDRVIAAMREWTGIPTLFDGEETYQEVVARHMIRMTQSLNEEWEAHVNVNPDDGNVGVNCYTCHRGEPVPSNVWFRISPVNQATAGWSANQNRATVQSQFTALPSDALEKYLLEMNPINVHDLEPRVSRAAANPATIQDTYRTYALMNYFSNSLGVNCVFCHNTRAFYDPAQNTPQWTNASLGIIMVQEINNDWLVPIEDAFPPERLGPVFGDVAKVACATCHKGYQQPLQRTDMISDWPELAGTGAPIYD